jgi:hypothetical protein
MARGKGSETSLQSTDLDRKCGLLREKVRLVVEQHGRRIGQRSFEVSALRDHGTLDIDVLGRLDAR